MFFTFCFFEKSNLHYLLLIIYTYRDCGGPICAFYRIRSPSFSLCKPFKLILILFILQPDLVRRVEQDLLNIMAGGPSENADIL